MKNNHFDKGITLIALVITIIVLLILAGVTISMVLGENGIIGRAIHAKNEWERQAFKEEVQLDIASVKFEYQIMGINNISLVQLEESLSQTYGYETTLKNDGTLLSFRKGKINGEIDSNFILTLKGEEKDTIPPTGVATYSITVPTIDHVIATITTSEDILIPDGWKRVDNTTYTKEYTTNISEQISIKDLSGNIGTVMVEITNIRTGKTDAYSKSAFKEAIDLDVAGIRMELYGEGNYSHTIQDVVNRLPSLGYTVTPYQNYFILEKGGGLANINSSFEVTAQLGRQ